MALKTNYKEDVLAASSTKRKYNMITNADGTVSFEDVTEYQQTGDNFGAGDINRTNTAVNGNAEKIVSNSEQIQKLQTHYQILGVAYTDMQTIGSSSADKKMKITPPEGTVQIVPFFIFLKAEPNSTINGCYVTKESNEWYISVSGSNISFQVGYLAFDKARS